MFEDIDFRKMESQISPLKGAWIDREVPEEVELLPNNRYAPGYAWMFSYEKRLKHRIEKTLGHPLGSLERRLFDSDGGLSEGFSNAFVHGNRRNAALPIEVHTAVGRGGLAFSIQDQGAGFDVASTIRAAKRNGRTFFHIAGNGIRSLLTSQRIVVSYSRGGRTLNLMLMFSSLSQVLADLAGQRGE